MRLRCLMEVSIPLEIQGLRNNIRWRLVRCLSGAYLSSKSLIEQTSSL